MSTYSQIYIQVVFAVRGRRYLIDESWEASLQKYITGIVQNKGQRMLAINGMPDHLHLLIGMKPSCCLSDLIREVKKSSHSFIEENKFTEHSFSWQEGFGAFSYSQSDLRNVISYVINQKEHHRKISFEVEYREFLSKYDIVYDDKYLFGR